MLDINKVPQELRDMNNWILWKLVLKDENGKLLEKPRKVPLNAQTLRGAMSDNKNTWNSFNTAFSQLKAHPEVTGLGFMLSDNIACIDLDNKEEDNLLSDEDFQALLDDCLDKVPSYCEISQSGKGYHIFARGNLPRGSRRKGHVEMYDNVRFIAFTGNIYKNYAKFINAQEGLVAIHAKYLGGEKKPRESACNQRVVETSVTVDKVLERAKSNSKFMTLYAGNWKSLGFKSQSEADSSFAALLAFYAGKNIKVMDDVFRSSGLMRDKYERTWADSTYGMILLEKANEFITDTYTEHKEDTELVSYGIKPTIKEVTKSEVVNPIITTAMFTDTANSAVLLETYGEDILYNFDNKVWYIWNGVTWEWDSKDKIRTYAEKVANKELEKATQEGNIGKTKNAKRMLNTCGKNNMINEARQHRGITNVECDSDKLLINTQSGIIDLEHGKDLPADKNKYMTKATSVRADSGKPKLWLSFLNDIFNGNSELIDYIQKAVGYTLSGSIKEQVVFILFGEGNNGKSVFVDTIQKAMGDYATTVPVEVLMEKKNQGNVETTLARIKGARMVHASENGIDDKINEGLIKQITGGEKVVGRFLFGNQFEYYPEYKLWLSTNNKPRIKGTDLGIWRRMVVIPFDVIISADKVDKDLGLKLIDELPQILNWAVEGFKKYQRKGLVLPQILIDEKNKYRSEMDFMANFILDKMDRKQGYKIQASVAYSEYEKWCRSSNTRPMTCIAFGKEFGKHFERKREGTGNVYLNCRTKADDEDFTMKSFGGKKK